MLLILVVSGAAGGPTGHLCRVWGGGGATAGRLDQV